MKNSPDIRAGGNRRVRFELPKISSEVSVDERNHVISKTDANTSLKVHGKSALKKSNLKILPAMEIMGKRTKTGGASQRHVRRCLFCTRSCPLPMKSDLFGSSLNAGCDLSVELADALLAVHLPLREEGLNSSSIINKHSLDPKVCRREFKITKNQEYWVPVSTVSWKNSSLAFPASQSRTSHCFASGKEDNEKYHLPFLITGKPIPETRYNVKKKRK